MTFSNVTLQIDMSVMAEQQELTYNGSVQTQEVQPGAMDERDVWRSRESPKSVLVARLDNDDDLNFFEKLFWNIFDNCDDKLKLLSKP